VNPRRHLKSWNNHVRDRLVVPLGDPKFFTETEDELANRLHTTYPAAAEALLEEAREMNEGIARTTESIELRAMTLQGAVAIATTLALAAGGLLLDRTKVPSHEWRIALGVVLTLAVGAFIFSGLRALGASSKTHPWAVPAYDDIFDHASMSLARAQAARAAAQLKVVGYNERIVSVKAGYLNAAVFWFRIALVLLLASAAMLLVYNVKYESQALRKTSPPRVCRGPQPVLRSTSASSRTAAVATKQSHRSPRPCATRQGGNEDAASAR
jgi:hypothetical protein